ncbi:putative ABC multidrug transporter [Fusarium oxysporum]|nr:putative ABC multidrug transporter [Fusarium oxysporum]
MTKQYRGEVAYNQEVDEHFPHLTVGETLSFAAAARDFIDTIVKVVMAVFGLSHTYHTKVGNNFVRGVSGGERKRVSIAEITRGLDATTALRFIKSLRLSADLGRSCHAVAAYQSSQSMYDLFDKVVILRAVEYFQDMGWHRDPRQVSSDFLTAITNPVPRTAAEFAEYWRRSQDYERLKADISAYEREHPLDKDTGKQFHESHKKQQARHTRPTSPYLLSIPMQIRVCLRRAFQRMRNDIPTTMSTVIAQLVLSFIIGSMFYKSPNTSNAFFQKGAVIFFAVLMNALITINEIMQLYSQRPIVEKQARYAFVHPFTEALASVVIDLPIKLFRCSLFSVVLYFLVNLRREPAQFFIFYLFLITTVLVMSGIFRSAASATRTIGQAMGIAGILVLAIAVYSGFMVPQAYMHPWLAWIRWINPICYAFEGLLSNEFHGREFDCAQLVPPYGTGDSVICAAVGAVPGQRSISGDAFLEANYGYTHAHLWRNYGILVAFLVFFHLVYLAATEFNKGQGSKAEALVFRPGHAPHYLEVADVEGTGKENHPISPSPGGDKMVNLPQHNDVLTWRDVNYDIPVKDGMRRLLKDVNGWVKPGTLTALMGVSGAGKTTLLDVLAQRASIGVVTGDILVNGQVTTSGFPRRAGYVQQQDLHLETTTVREALRFSAVLRQPRYVSKKEKYKYVEGVIQMLGMEDFAEAVVGSLGEGLNVDQRKLLSIGVELVAKPSLLIFLDEPTSGLDSQGSWTICTFLRRLADNGQAVLATIHQPSALLFQTFDRLLFLAQGGKTVYFGDIGPQSRILLDYFARAGSRPCGEQENPAEYILEMVSGDGVSGVDLVEQWNSSPERDKVLAELDRPNSRPEQASSEDAEKGEFYHEFALPLCAQFVYVADRAFKQYFRQPEYIFTKFLLGIASGLFIGLSFWKTDDTQQGFQNALFGIFLLATIFPTLVNQIMPKFVIQRSLYEVREQPSRAYSWKVFILSQMLVEVPWQILLGICAWACFYFPVFGVSGSADSQGLFLLLVIQFYMYAATIAQMVAAAISDPALGAVLAVLMFGLSFIFNGVIQPPDALPGFWIFMWRVSPFTYYLSGLASAALHGRKIVCSDSEMSTFDPPSSQTCGAYLAMFLQKAPGTLYNPDATSGCQYCSLSSAEQYLAARQINWNERWRNYGIFCCYMVFNVFGTLMLYYLFRVRNGKVRKVAK